LTVDFDEPTMNAPCGTPVLAGCGTPLTDLAKTSLWYTLTPVGGGPGLDQFALDLPASSPTGGQHRTVTFLVPATSGTVTVWLTATDLTGNTGARSLVATKVLTPTVAVPDKGGIAATVITVPMTQMLQQKAPKSPTNLKMTR
jgi:hypothetical protein